MPEKTIADVLTFYDLHRRKFLVLYLFLFLVFAWVSLSGTIPDSIYVEQGEEVQIGKYLPVTTSLRSGEKTVESFDMYASETAKVLPVRCRLLGVIPVKDVMVHIVPKESVIPGGVPVGIYVQTKGVLVVDTADPDPDHRQIASPSRHVLKRGDYIVAVNHAAIARKEQLVHSVQSSHGEPLLLRVLRGGKEMELSVLPVSCGRKGYRIGAWVRDDMAGVGTLTFLKEDLSFGALGHSICDSDTQSAVELQNGKVYKVDIIDVIKGEKGNPGELVGQIQYDSGNEIGRIRENTENGVFGKLDAMPVWTDRSGAMEICHKQEIRAGKAQILLELDSERKLYEIEIEYTDMTPETPNKGIRFRVTDEELIAKTGGIIQGLSGAPIIQNHRIIGGVTHVFVNDPLEGYGIFIEDMLDQLTPEKT